jgi:HEAT repeat protein
MPSIRRICCSGVLVLGILGIPACKKTASAPPDADSLPSASGQVPPLDEASAKIVAESIEKLKDPDARTRQLAAETLSKYQTESSIAPLAQCFKDADEGVRKAAAASLEHIGNLAGQELLKTLGDPDEKVRVGAITVLWRASADAAALRSDNGFAVLLAALKDQTVHVRIYAAMILGYIGADAKRAIPDLIQASKDLGNMGTRLATNPGSVTEAAIQAALKIDPECGDALAKEALPALIAALQSDDAAMVQAAGFALAKLGPRSKPAIDAIKAAQKRKLDKPSFADMALSNALKTAGGGALLVEVIADSSTPVKQRLDAISALDPESGEQGVAVLIKALGDSEPEIRTAAADRLERFGPKAKSAIPALIAALPDRKIRDYTVTFALSSIGPDAHAAMIKVLNDHDARPALRYHVAVTLGRMAKKAKSALPALEANLADKNPAIALACAEAIAAIGGNIEKALPVARAELQSKTSFYLYLAARALEKMGVRAAAAVPELQPLLKNEDAEVRVVAALALGKMGSAAKPAVPVMAKMLASDDPRERYQTAQALAELGSDAVEALPALIAGLDKLPEVYPHPVLTTLGHLGPAAKTAVPALIVLSNKDSLLASQSIDVLAEIGPDAKEAVPALTKKLDAKSELYRRRTARTLGLIGPAAMDAVPALKSRLIDESQAVRVWAAFALFRITSDQAHVQFLVSMWNEPSSAETHHELGQVFETLGPDARLARDALLACITDDRKWDFATRLHAATALGRMSADTEVIMPKLLALLDKKGPADNFRIAAEGLEQMGPKAKAAIPQLQKLLDHEQEYVAECARKAIAKIDPK